MSEVRVAIVGSGGIADRHGHAIQENANAELVAVIDVNPDASERFCARWGGQPFGRLQDCIDRVDAVYVLTPPSFRKEIALEALKANKHLFCEKPLASTEEDALAIKQAADNADVVSMMGLNMRFRTGFSRLHKTVSAGLLGTPYHFWRSRRSAGPGVDGRKFGDNWRTNPSLIVGMTVESFSHEADLLRWMMNDEVETVSALTHGTISELPNFDNNAHVLLKMREGATAIITASWTSRIGFNDCGILGDQGTAFISGTALGNNGAWCSQQFHIKTDKDDHERIDMIHDDLDDASYDRETDDFINAILTGSEPLTGIRDGYETMRISSAVLRAAKTNSVVGIG